MSGMLWLANPRRKRKGSRKLSKKQIAAGFGGGSKRRRRRSSKARRHKRSVRSVAAAPVVHRRRRRSRGASGVVRRRRGGRRSGGMKGNVINLLKAGAIGGAGAVAVDMIMGQVRGFLPASLGSPVDSAGQPNYGYFGTKAAIALALGVYGNKLPVVGGYTSRMSEGALTVLAYQFMRPMVPQSFMLGYFNPAPTQRASVGKYVSGQRPGNRYLAGTGAYQSIPVRGGDNGGSGERAAQVVAIRNRAG